VGRKDGDLESGCVGLRVVVLVVTIGANVGHTIGSAVDNNRLGTKLGLRDIKLFADFSSKELDVGREVFCKTRTSPDQSLVRITLETFFTLN